MWNKLYANRFLNEEDKLYDHKLFCERIALIKSHCNTSPPKEYRFLKVRAKKVMMERDKQMNIDYNNNLLMKKLIEMERRPQQYHPKTQKFYPHPTSFRFSKTSSKHHEYDNLNDYLKKRIASAKTVYSRDKSLKNYERNVYVENLLLKNSKHYNPYMNFCTPDMFQRSLYERVMTFQGDNILNKNKLKKVNNNSNNSNNKWVIDSENRPKIKNQKLPEKSKPPLKYEIIRTNESDDIDTRMLTKYSVKEY